MPRVAYRVLVSGRVQGVGFRWATQTKASELGVDGWVRNLRDGRVEVWLEGEEEDGAPARMLDWLADGPRFASVRAREVYDAEPTGARGFDVRPTG